MKILEIDNAIQTCRSHILSLPTKEPKIEYFLTCYLLILIAIYFEKEIKKMVSNNIQTCKGSKKLLYYFQRTDGTQPNGLKTSQLPQFLGKFGAPCQKNFEKQCLESKNARAVSAYNDMIQNRHYAAHREEITMTFDEVIVAYEKGHIILDIFSESLRKRR